MPSWQRPFNAANRLRWFNVIYAFGIAGFVLGFAAGLFIINMFLKNLSKRELLGDKSLRWTYGLAVWLFAGLGAWGGVWLYERSIL